MIFIISFKKIKMSSSIIKYKNIIKKLITDTKNNHKNIKQIINIQKYVRRFLIQKHILIPSSFYQTKDWRKNRQWYKNGK